jgi:hypothetical protein
MSDVRKRNVGQKDNIAKKIGSSKKDNEESLLKTILKYLAYGGIISVLYYLSPYKLQIVESTAGSASSFFQPAEKGDRINLILSRSIVETYFSSLITCF